MRFARPEGGGEVAMVVAACALAVAMLLRAQPLWTIGFYQDDALIASYAYDAVLRGSTTWEYCVDMMRNLLRFQGRIAPVFAFIITPLQLWVGDNLFVFRLITSLAQLAALGSFCLLVATLLRSRHAALVAAAAFVAIFELRDYHDSAHSTFILMPILVCAGCMACWLACRSLEKPRAYGPALWGVIGLNALAMVTYEMAVPLIAFSCLILLLGGPFPWRTRLARAGLAAAPMIVIVLAGTVAKALFSVYEGTQIGSLEPAVVAAAYVKHLSGGVPLTYWWNDPHRLFGSLFAGTRLAPGPLVSAAAVGVAVACAAYLPIARMNARVSVAALFGAMALFALPAALVAVSAKYQKEALWGLGYLQNVLTYLGASLLLACVAALLARLGPVPRLIGAIALSLALGAVASISLVASGRTAAAINDTWKFPRERMEAWMHATRSPDAPALVVMDRGWLNRWEWPPFMLQHWGVRGKFETAQQADQRPTPLAPAPGVAVLRTPERLHPRSLALFVDSTVDGTGPRVRAVVMSTQRDLVADRDLALLHGGERVAFPPATTLGRHGYFLREVTLRPAAPANVREYALVIGGP